MPDSVANLFLAFSNDRLQLFTSRIVDCLGRVSNEQIWARGAENENSIGNLVLHLCGNVRQWIVSGVGGEADVRDRDAEFAALGGADARELQDRIHFAQHTGQIIFATKMFTGQDLGYFKHLNRPAGTR